MISLHPFLLFALSVYISIFHSAFVAVFFIIYAEALRLLKSEAGAHTLNFSPIKTCSKYSVCVCCAKCVQTTNLCRRDVVEKGKLMFNASTLNVCLEMGI